MKKGQIVRAKKNCGTVCVVGEQGVAVDEYRMGGRVGWTILFENGGYDGFSAEEVDMFLDKVDAIDTTAQQYSFKNVMQLTRDYEKGLFAKAFSYPSCEDEGCPHYGTAHAHL